MTTVARWLVSLDKTPDDNAEFVAGKATSCVGAMRKLLRQCPPNAELTGFEVGEREGDDVIRGVEIRDARGQLYIVRFSGRIIR